MEVLKYSRIGLVTILWLISTVLITSCDEEETKAEIVVANVFRQERNNTTEILTEAELGTLVRIEGSGFSTLKAIYFNGVEVAVNPNFVTDNSVIVQIPSENIPVGSEIEDETIRNTIRIVTVYHDYSHPFLLKAAPPVINAVSHTMANVGEKIEIYGISFRGVESVTFPGNIPAMDFEVSTDFKTIVCTVPAGVTKGVISVNCGANGIANSYDYMFRNECLIINWNFGQGYGGSFGEVSPLSATKTAAFPAAGNPSSPAGGYRHCPNTDPPSTTKLPISNGNACGFNFNPKTAMEALINNTGGLITATTNCNNLALQMDFYISAPWGSGYFKVNFKPGTESYSAIISPQWATIGKGKDITMTGWLTATLPLANVPSLQAATVQTVIDELTTNGTFTFINNNFTLSGTSYTAKEIQNFQLFMGHFRIVPYVKP